MDEDVFAGEELVDDEWLDVVEGELDVEEWLDVVDEWLDVVDEWLDVVDEWLEVVEEWVVVVVPEAARFCFAAVVQEGGKCAEQNCRAGW